MHVNRALALIACFALIASLPSIAADGAKLKYPDTATGEVVEDYHGTQVPDPYRWLEDDVRTSKEVEAWVEAENAVTMPYLESIPEREQIINRLTELWDYEKYSSPFKVGSRYYYFKNDGLQNQSVLYGLERFDGEPKVVLDPNTWSEDGTVALGGMSFSDNGKYVAYAKAEAGSDWRKWYVRDLALGTDLPDELRWVKFTGASWTADNKGFFYSRFEQPEEGQEFQALNLNQKMPELYGASAKTEIGGAAAAAGSSSKNP